MTSSGTSILVEKVNRANGNSAPRQMKKKNPVGEENCPFIGAYPIILTEGCQHGGSDESVWNLYLAVVLTLSPGLADFVICLAVWPFTSAQQRFTASSQVSSATRFSYVSSLIHFVLL